MICHRLIVDKNRDRSRFWATRALIAELVLLLFSFILIGIAGDYVQSSGYLTSSYYGVSYNWASTITDSSALSTKLKITQAQLAFGILLMFSGWIYVGLYLYVTYIALWRPYKTLDLSHLFHP